LGSGLGVDSFLACHYSGPKGKVIGLDISSKEVKHAEQRAAARGVDMKFVVADMENIPLPDEMIDVVISNGAFCLAPNKEKAFSEIFRVLRPGGRMAICTSSVNMDLEAGVNWPVCMRMFIHKSKLEPICREIGFYEVIVDDSNSMMAFDLPEDVMEEESKAEEEEAKGEEEESKEEAKTEEKSFGHRNQVHVGSKEFEHLKNFDMNKICARVVVFAKKPLV
jgi:ubiquinone/menaquinone biosynthesis C-methylase UbiE